MLGGFVYYINELLLNAHIHYAGFVPLKKSFLIGNLTSPVLFSLEIE